MEKKPESIFINRELSWLDFDSRVLALAKEKTVPLGERIKFAAIFGSNMDEFFMVRVGSLYDQTLLKNNKTDNVTHMTAAEQIAAITPRCCSKYTTIVVVSRAFVKVGAEILQIQIFASPTGESFLIFASEASTPPYCCRACRCIRRAGSRQGPRRRGPRQEPGLRFQTQPRRTRRPWAGRGPRS